MVPGDGVYFCTAVVGVEGFPAVCNVGSAPTVTDGVEKKIECHLLDFHRDIYGQRIQVFFHKKIRDEKKFPNVEALRTQIEADVALARTLV